MSTTGTSTDTLMAQLPPRERILVAAHDLFYGEGIRATGIDKIIERSQVTKVTFYRQYPSKDDLVRAYLAYRHELWMGWFRAALMGHVDSGRSATQALVATLAQWFERPDFRGCAFLNSATELGSSDPEILELVRQHKADMTAALETLLPAGTGRAAKARALALAVDGAIVHAQMGVPVDKVLDTFQTLIGPACAR